MTVTFSIMPLDEVVRVGEIDRSEEIQLKYQVKAGELQAIPHALNIRTWSGAWLADNIQHWSESVQAGGTMLGAFDGDQFVGFAILGNQWLGEAHDFLQLVALYVSRPYRRQGIAARLVEQVSQLAKAQGAAYLYISASETESAVGFYLNQGCIIAPQVDPTLYALEPEDIHLLKPL